MLLSAKREGSKRNLQGKFQSKSALTIGSKLGSWALGQQGLCLFVHPAALYHFFRMDGDVPAITTAFALGNIRDTTGMLKLSATVVAGEGSIGSIPCSPSIAPTGSR